MEEKAQQAIIDNLIALIYTTAAGDDTWQSLLAQASELIDGGIQGDGLTAALNRLHFHFDQAKQIQRKHEGFNSEHYALSNTLDHLPLAIVITLPDGRILKTNSQAKKLLSAGTMIHSDVKERLCLTGLKKQTRMLHQSITDMLFLRQRDTVRTLVVDHPSTDRQMSITMVATDHHPELKKSSERLVTLYISSASVQQEISQHWLEEKYCLLPHEAQLIYRLVNESSNLAEAAESLDLSLQTVRSYLKKIFSKTDTHSQPELFKRILKDAPFLYDTSEKDVDIDKQKTPVRTTRLIRLGDGRRLGFSEYGALLGKPVLFFHSYIGSRLQVHPDHSLLEQAGIRLIVPDRPGFGLSDSTNNHTPAHWAQDVGELLDDLGIDKAPIIAFCIGATFAFACAHAMPEKVEKLVIINPLGEINSPADLKGMLPLNKMILRSGLLSHTLMRNLVNLTFRDFSKRPEKLLEYLKKQVTPADLHTLTDNDICAVLADCYHETLLQGSDAIYKELLICLSQWESMLTEINTEVDLIHGSACRHVPLHFGKRIAGLLPNCTCHVLEDAGFYLIFEKWHKILDLAIQPLRADNTLLTGTAWRQVEAAIQ